MDLTRVFTPVMRWAAATAAAACLSITAGAAELPSPGGDAAEFFETHIRPVLARSCYQCHSEQAAEQHRLKAQLRLDSWSGMSKGGESGTPAVVPGDLAGSALIKAIHYQNRGDDADLNMPPLLKDGTGGKLPDQTIALFEQWIKMGAPYPRTEKTPASPAALASHWAFERPREPEIPVLKNPLDAARVQSPIDAFILSKLEAKGLTLNPPADKRTLLRRVTFDLVGLPPTPQELDGFLKDDSAGAFARVVDRLLASPRYGERWGRHWLDVARYADSKGYVFQEERRFPFAYTYRDWVIRAFNEDLPYDQFLIQQIAADKLNTGDDRRPLAALGFLTVGRRFLNHKPDIIDDRIDVVCRGTMALTVGCARCHDHKFDPIPTKDYYSLYGVFDSSVEPEELPLLEAPKPTPENEAFEKELTARRDAVEAYVREQSDLVLAAAAQSSAIADYFRAAHSGGAEGGDAKGDLNRHILAGFKALLATAKDADRELGPWKAYAALPEDEFAAASPGLTQRLFEDSGDGSSPGRYNPLVRAIFAGNPPDSLWDVAERYGTLLGGFPTPDATSSADEESVREVLFGQHKPFDVPAAERLALLNRQGFEKRRDLEKRVQTWLTDSPNSPARAMVLADAPQPHDSPVLLRGNVNNPGPNVPRHFLTVLSHGAPEAFKDGSGRLELAKAIASRDNPLTARVIVNRAWLYHFGRGIVRTPSDFGMRSDPPSHQELLDYLALRFTDPNGCAWSLKKLHRLILLSSAYQQSSEDNATAHAVDPENVLLWRANRQRLDFEAIHDSLLSVAGRLDTQMGGRPVDLRSPDTTRRSVYGAIDRQNLPGLFRAFDFASPDSTSPQRFVTTVPQQALFFMNSQFVLRQVQALVSRPDLAISNPQDRIRHAYLLLFGREPSPDELHASLQYLQDEVVSVGHEPPVWQYGFGSFDESSKRVRNFSPLPEFTGTAWQGGAKMPDAAMGWVELTAKGGHPGDDSRHAAIRRWTAPADGVISLIAQLDHDSARGDGVRGRLVSSREGLLRQWAVHHAAAAVRVDGISVSAGDTIDLVVDCRETLDYDAFGSSLTIHSTAGAEWNSVADFGGPPPRLSPWEKWAQVLLESNEFVFVD